MNDEDKEISDEEIEENWNILFRTESVSEVIKIEMAMIEKEYYEQEHKLH